MHLKRRKAPKTWPIPQKGTSYVVRPSSNIQNGIPILIILRDLLKVAQNKKEVKKALHSKHILLNNKLVQDEKNAALLFDVITIVPAKKSYRLELSNKGKFTLKEISEKETNHKVAKVIGKKTLKGKKTQLNLSDGRNFISGIACKVDDSVLINLKDKKIEKCLPLREKAKVVVFAGKHSGERGSIEKIKPERKMVSIDASKGKTNVLIKQIIIVE